MWFIKYYKAEIKLHKLFKTLSKSICNNTTGNKVRVLLLSFERTAD